TEQVSRPTSDIYDGIVTWALDPLFPRGTSKLDTVTGKSYVEGSCSDPRFFTESQCLSAGFCQCNIGPNREGDNVREKCESTFFPGGLPCRFVPYNEWTSEGITAVTFGKCSDPTKRSKEDCLEKGQCSNPKLKGRKACLREGSCGGTGQNEKFDFSQFLTREECENPELRSGKGEDMEPGYCTARRGSRGPELHFNYRQFRNKANCEVPKSRKRPIDMGDSSPKTDCGTCKKPSDGPEEVEPFTYDQFKTKENCEVPKSRGLPVIGTCGMPREDSGLIGAVGDGNPTEKKQYDGTNDPGLCLPILSVEYPSTFNCRYLTDQGKESCEKPEKRKQTDCATSLFASTLAHCYDEEKKESTMMLLQLDKEDEKEDYRGRYYSGTYPDLSVRHGKDKFSNQSDPEVLNGPPCRWSPVGDIYPQPDRMHDGQEWMSDCGPGPKGEWIGKLEDDECKKSKIKFPGPRGKWHPLDNKSDGGPPGMWFSLNSHKSDNDWTRGPDELPTCPCNWQQKLWHLTKCNWKTCGPSMKGNLYTRISKHTLTHTHTHKLVNLGTPGGVQEFIRLKGPNEYVSDYQAYVMVGGGQMWMTLETGKRTHDYLSLSLSLSLTHTHTHRSRNKLGYEHGMLHNGLQEDQDIYWNVSSSYATHIYSHRYV
ncbi:hypothetical protein OAV88_04060, partial [bacterium]|nr:hypothetical protein [bacterium]